MFAPRLARIGFASLLALSCLPAKAQDAPGARMRAEAQALIAAVDAGKRPRLVLPLGDPQRAEWHYTPRSRPGLALGELDLAQRESVHRLLRSALSSVGHRKMVNIIELELVLREVEAFGFMRDPEKYSVVFFGVPDASQPWSWRFEGHHLSLNFTLRGDAAVATTPSFFGANPAEVPKGPKKGLRVLAREEDEARRLLGSLDDAQRRTAIVDSRSYGDIVTGAKDRVGPLDNRGIEARTLDAAQKAQLKKLIEVYADSFEPSLRAERLARALEDLDSIRFAWAGPTERGKPHYYRVQGARFLIEYDSSQNDGNHVHTVWRDFNGDFGRDLLREHHSRMRH